MKVNQTKTPFQPVNITLESILEVNTLWKLLAESIQGPLDAYQKEVRLHLMHYLESVNS